MVHQSPLRCELLRLTITQLRQKCTKYGLRGHYRRGMTKSRIVTLLEAHLTHLGYDSLGGPVWEGHMPPEVFLSIAQYVNTATFVSLLRTSKSIAWYLETERRQRHHRVVCSRLRRGTGYNIGLFLPQYETIAVKHLGMTREDYRRLSPPTEEMMIAFAPHIRMGKGSIDTCLSHLSRRVAPDLKHYHDVQHQGRKFIQHMMSHYPHVMTKRVWIALLENDPLFYRERFLPLEYYSDENIQLAVVQQKVSNLFRLFQRPISEKVRVAAAYHNYKTLRQLTDDEITDNVLVGAYVQGGLFCDRGRDRLTPELKQRINKERRALGKRQIP